MNWPRLPGYPRVVTKDGRVAIYDICTVPVTKHSPLTRRVYREDVPVTLRCEVNGNTIVADVYVDRIATDIPTVWPFPIALCAWDSEGTRRLWNAIAPRLRPLWDALCQTEVPR